MQAITMRRFASLLIRVVALLAVLQLAVTPIAQAAPHGMSVGGCAVVTGTGSPGLKVRSGPGLGYSQVGTIYDGTVVRLTGGPTNADGYTWWQHDRGGWSAGNWLADASCPGGGGSGNIQLVEGLNISPSNPQAGQSLRAYYKARNNGSGSITLEYLGVKCRRNSDGANYDFDWRTNISLSPGQEYSYESNRAFDQVATYSCTPNYRQNGNWSDLKWPNGSSNYVSVQVQNAPPLPSPGAIVLTQDLSVSPTTVGVNQSVSASYRYKNVGGQPITLDFIGIQGRLNGDVNGTARDFNWDSNVTLQPGEERTYSSSRSFDIGGNWTLRPNYKKAGGEWDDVHRSDGSTNTVWLTVQGSPPPSPTTPSAPPPSPTTPVPGTTPIRHVQQSGAEIALVDLSDPRVYMWTAIARNGQGGLESVASIAQSKGAALGINGDYFSPTCPVNASYSCAEGMTYVQNVDRTNATWDVKNHRSSLAFSADNQANIGIGEAGRPRYMVIGGGPQLIRDGQSLGWNVQFRDANHDGKCDDGTGDDVQINGELFGCSAMDWSGAMRLTAAGLTRDGKTLIVLASSGNLTPQQLIDLLLSQGAWSAMRLDSRSSTSMYYPAGGVNFGTKQVANALLVVVGQARPPSPAPTDRPSSTATPVPTTPPTATTIPTQAPTNTPTYTLTSTATVQPTNTLTNVPTKTMTPMSTPTNTPFTTSTPPKSPTATVVNRTATALPTATATATRTNTITRTATRANTPSSTPTNTPSSCVPGASQVALFRDPDYKGQCVVLDIGQYPNAGAIGLPDNTISALQVGLDVEVVLSSDSNYSGRSEMFRENDPNLRDNLIRDNAVSSVRVQLRNAPTATLSPANTRTATIQRSSTPTRTPTVQRTNTPTRTASPTRSATASRTSTIVPSAIQTQTPLPTQTPTPLPPPTVTPTRQAADVVIMSENFDTTFPTDRWQVTNHWGQRACEAAGGGGSAWVEGAGNLPCGSAYHTSERSWMIFGPFSLADAAAARLTYQMWLNSEPNFDYLFVGASVDGTNFSGTAYSGTSGAGAKAAKQQKAKFSVATGKVKVQKPENVAKERVKAVTTSWVARTLDLANVPTLGNLIGQSNVWIAFVWNSDGSITLPQGAFVDDIVLSKYLK